LIREITVPKLKHESHLYEFAKLGAEARLRDVVNELKQLLDLFPHLKDNFDPDELPIPFILKRGANRAANRPETAEKTEKNENVKPSRGRRTMSAEAREKIRQAQLKRWAKQRSAAKK
jgi:hypothetical protein